MNMNMNKTTNKTTLRSALGGIAGLIASIAMISSSYAAIPSGSRAIDANMGCQNAWMPGGSNSGAGDGLSPMWPMMQQAKYGTIRLGGNQSMSTYEAPYVQPIVESISGIGAKSWVQVPDTMTYSQAKAYVTDLNNPNGKNLKIHLWSIGNERNLNGPWTATQIANAVKSIAPAIRDADPSAYIIVGDLAWYDQPMVDAFFTVGNAAYIGGKDSAGRYYVNAFSWHHYNNYDVSEERAHVLDIQAKSAAIRPAGQGFGWVIGEWNSHHHTSWYTAADGKLKHYVNPNDARDVNYLYPWSMGAGQNFARLQGLGYEFGSKLICPWAMAESSGERWVGPPGNGHYDTDLGIFDNKDGNGNAVWTPRSSYWHQSMLQRYQRDFYLKSTFDSTGSQGKATSTSTGYGYLTSIAMGDDIDGITVMVMNSNESQGFNYTVNLNNTSSSSDININVNGGMSTSFSTNIGAFETQLLVFNNVGQLASREIYNKSNHMTKRIAPTVDNGGSSNTGAGAPTSSGGEKLANTKFATNVAGWTLAPNTAIYGWSSLAGSDAAAGIMKADMVAPASTNRYDKRVYQDINVTAGKTYKLSVTLRLAAAGNQKPAVVVEKNGTPYSKYIDISLDSVGTNDIGLTSAANPAPLTSTTWRTFTGSFVAPSSEQVRVEVMTGLVTAGMRVDNFSLIEQ